jgi:hypothetical protein
MPQLRRTREAARLGQAHEVFKPLGFHAGQCSQAPDGLASGASRRARNLAWDELRRVRAIGQSPPSRGNTSANISMRFHFGTGGENPTRGT